MKFSLFGLKKYLTAVPLSVILLACGYLTVLGSEEKLTADSSPVEHRTITQLFTITYQPIDSMSAQKVAAMISAGIVDVERFFGHPFHEPVVVTVCPDRASFTKTFPAEWNMTETECWMVASGVANSLTAISPRVWKAQACEHNPDDSQHVRNILVHELVHVFHGQYNPTGNFEGTDSLDWFIEGLATYVSGQLEDGHLAPAAEAVRRKLDPSHLANAWSGKYRYGVCGSLVKYLDQTYGRKSLNKLLSATTLSQLLSVIHTSESELLAGWREFVLAKT